VRAAAPGKAVKAVSSGPGAALWLVDIGGLEAASVDSFAARLDDGEAARYARFARPLRRRQFLLGRMLLRHAVGALLGVPAATVGAFEQPGQAPRLRLADAARAIPFFSLSHSADWVACAVSADAPLGLDIEVMDAARDVRALAAAAFDAGQCESLAGLPDAARVPAFYRLWCEMEARHKLGPLGPNAAPVCVGVPHESLSIALCSAAPLSAAPEVVTVAPAALV
jgi:4'-phosphopantetheinyl transferase